MMKISIARFFDQILSEPLHANFLDFTACSSKCAKKYSIALRLNKKVRLTSLLSSPPIAVAAGYEREPFRHGKEINRTSSMQ